MGVSYLGEQEAWDQALVAYTYPPFTQLWGWGEAQKTLGKHIERQTIETTHGRVLAQWIEERRGPLSYWFCPQGPVFPEGLSLGERDELIEVMQQSLPAASRTVFYRVEPRIRSYTAILEDQVQVLHAHRVRSLNPSTSFVVPLYGTPGEVQERMHKKTRYNIRLAERHAVIVRGGNEEDFTTFVQLMKETEDRDGFVGHDRHYLETVCQTLCRFGNARFRIAECLGKPLAANFEVLCGDTIMYLYGASSSEDREKMAPYALQWSAIFTAVQEGRRWYDFGGGNPLDASHIDFRASWEGITRFKERWGTMRITDAGTMDIVRRPLLYKLLVRR